jgi:hypothetical protein
MAEYIDRGTAIAKLTALEVTEPNATMADAKRVLADIPAADVTPVVHGRWVHLGGDEWCCSACGFVITTDGSWDKPTKKYCEDCSAKMDEKETVYD